MENRRSFLQWLSKLPLVGGLVLPTAAIAIETSSDEVERLLDIEARLKAALLDVDLAYRHYDECRHLANRLSGQCPVRMFMHDARDEWYWRHSYGRNQQRRARAVEEAGVKAANDRVDELRFLRDDIACEVSRVKATTMEGFKIKARMSKLTPYAATSLANDIDALPGEAHV